MNSTTHFRIEEIDKRQNMILVTVNTEDKGSTEIKVNRSKFEAYLDRVGALSVPLQLHDDEETSETVNSTMTLDEYYEHGDVHADLYSYILTSQGESIFTSAMDSINSICREFQN